jgi:hypothetical protein
MDRLDLGQKFGDVEDALRQVNQVRTVALDRPCGGGCGGQESGIASHHDCDVGARQGAIVEVGPHKRLDHETRRGRKTWRVIVVDGLRNVNGAQIVAFLRGLLADDAHGFGRVVAADIEEPGRVMSLKRCKDFPAVGQVGFVARRAEGRRWRGGDRFEIGSRFGGKVDEILVHNAAHPVARAIDPLDLRKEPRFENSTNEGLIDHGGRTAALGDHQLAASHRFLRHRCTRTGILRCVSTLTVSLPRTIAEMPRRPCEAMTIRSQPFPSAASIIAW